MSSTRHLVVEGQPAHFFLYALYSELAASQLLAFPHPMWHGFDDALGCIQRSITPLLRTVTFVTLEPLIYGPSRRAFNQLIQASGVDCFGILHRVPESAEQADALRESAPRLAGIMVLAEALVETLQERFQLDNVAYLPLHPAFARYVSRDSSGIRRTLGVSDQQVVFSVLGEARKGKGIDILLQALDYVQPDDLRDMFFLFGGRSADFDRRTISAVLVERQADHYIDLQSSENPLTYSVLSERVFGEYVNATDVGLVLYRHEQRTCMSGVAPNYVWGFKPLIAFADSVIGRTVAQHDLGLVVEEETPRAVARALTDALRMGQQRWQPTPSYVKYREEIAPEAVLTRLAAILSHTPGTLLKP